MPENNGPVALPSSQPRPGAHAIASPSAAPERVKSVDTIAAAPATVRADLLSHGLVECVVDALSAEESLELWRHVCHGLVRTQQQQVDEVDEEPPELAVALAALSAVVRGTPSQPPRHRSRPCHARPPTDAAAAAALREGEEALMPLETADALYSDSLRRCVGQHGTACDAGHGEGRAAKDGGGRV